MTVGKIYAGLLILENYRAYKMSLKMYGESRPVSYILYKFRERFKV